jgi:hypothetical protein
MEAAASSSAGVESSITLILTIARMNPPTPGHLILICNLIILAIINREDAVFVMLSETTAVADNPVLCMEKLDILVEGEDQNNMTFKLKREMITHPEITLFPALDILRGSRIITEEQYNMVLANLERINQIQVHYLCVKSPFLKVGSLIRESRPSTTIIIIGEDRKPLIDSISKSYGTLTHIEGISLDRPGMDSYKDKSIEELFKLDPQLILENKEAISASLIRKFVAFELRSHFDVLYGKYLNEPKISNLRKQIQEGFVRIIEAEEEAEQEKEYKKAAKSAKSAKSIKSKSVKKGKSVKGKTAKRKSGVISSDDDEEEEEA